MSFTSNKKKITSDRVNDFSFLKPTNSINPGIQSFSSIKLLMQVKKLATPHSPVLNQERGSEATSAIK